MENAAHPVKMTTKNDLPYLEGKLLIAMPGMGDSRFDRTVIYLCAHTPEGAMGLIVNKPSPELRFSDLLDQLDIKTSAKADEISVFFGGPVEHGRGFVLHSPDYASSDSTLKVNKDFGMTATLDILEDIANSDGPEKCLLALGYAGWGPGQLEAEIQANGWLVGDASHQLVFATKNQAKWGATLSSIGIDPKLLSAEGGRA